MNFLALIQMRFLLTGIMILLVAWRGYTQNLISFHITATGKVVAITQSPNKLSPFNPDYLLPYSEKKVIAPQDTVETEIIYFSPYGKHITPFTKLAVQHDSLLLFETPVFGSPGELVNSTDLTAFHQVPSDCNYWQKQDAFTYKFSCFGTGPFGRQITQIWKLDHQQRVAQIEEYDFRNDKVMSVKLIYNSKNQVQRISQHYYRRDYWMSHVRIDTANVHRIWKFDSQGRVVFWMQYAGPYRELNDAKVASYAQQLKQSIKTHTRDPKIEFDGIDIRAVLSYEYGSKGLATVNYCYQEMLDEFHPSYYRRHYQSDSLFYDSNGRIEKYVCSLNKQGYQCTILFQYNEATGQIARSVCTSRYPDNWITENSTEQYYEFKSSGKISFMQKLRYKRQYRRTNDGSSPPPYQLENETLQWVLWNN